MKWTFPEKNKSDNIWKYFTFPFQPFGMEIRHSILIHKIAISIFVSFCAIVAVSLTFFIYQRDC